MTCDRQSLLSFFSLEIIFSVRLLHTEGYPGPPVVSVYAPSGPRKLKAASSFQTRGFRVKYSFLLALAASAELARLHSRDVTSCTLCSAMLLFWNPSEGIRDRSPWKTLLSGTSPLMYLIINNVRVVLVVFFRDPSSAPIKARKRG